MNEMSVYGQQVSTQKSIRPVARGVIGAVLALSVLGAGAIVDQNLCSRPGDLVERIARDAATLAVLPARILSSEKSGRGCIRPASLGV